MDRTLGHQELEAADGIALAPGHRSVSDQWQHNAAVIASSVACAVHGCCDGEWAEEEERWDGLE
jgi:hypothetical protein